MVETTGVEAEALVAEEILADAASVIVDQEEKCTVPSAVVAERTAKFLSDQPAQNPFIAVNVLKNNRVEEIQGAFRTEAQDDRILPAEMIQDHKTTNNWMLLTAN